MTELEVLDFKTILYASRDVVHSPAGSAQVVLTQLLVPPCTIAQRPQ